MATTHAATIAGSVQSGRLRLVGGGRPPGPLPDSLCWNSRLAESEIRLMFAILEDAIALVVANRRGGARRHGRAKREALEWMQSDDRRHLYAFENICDALDIDGPTLRRGVLREAGLEVDASIDHPRGSHLPAAARLAPPR